jgi:hypothetical protein
MVNTFTENHQESYSVEEEEKLTFEKILVSGGAGYAFELRKAFLKTSLGVKSVYYTTGSYEYHLAFIEDGVSTIEINKQINPFNNQDLVRSADKTNFEIWIAAAVTLYKSFSILIGFSQPLNQIYFEEKRPNFFHIYSKGDLSVTLRYYLRPKQLKK